MKQETRYIKLIKTHKNNIIISNMNLKDKFTQFENSKLDESATLLYEISVKPTTFRRYSRGQVVKVKFGVNIGSEFSGDHYAVVISKQDTMRNPILHVIPLTSKKHNYKISYACIKHLRTVSKLSIRKSINEFDYLDKIKISNDLLRKIDEEIVKEYTLF